MAARHLETGLLFQKRQEGHFPRDEHSESLPVALPRQNTALHVQVRPEKFGSSSWLLSTDFVLLLG